MTEDQRAFEQQCEGYGGVYLTGQDTCEFGTGGPWGLVPPGRAKAGRACGLQRRVESGRRTQDRGSPRAGCRWLPAT